MPVLVGSTLKDFLHLEIGQMDAISLDGLRCEDPETPPFEKRPCGDARFGLQPNETEVERL